MAVFHHHTMNPTHTGAIHSLEITGDQARWKLAIPRASGTVDYRFRATGREIVQQLQGTTRGQQVAVSAQMANGSAPGESLFVTALRCD